MQLLLASDLHYALPQLDWIADQAADFDLVVLAGDHLDLRSAVPLDSQIVVVRTYVRRIGEQTAVAFASGNHDLTARNDHDEKAAPWIEEAADDGAVVDWGRWERDGVRVTVCPWWDGPRTRDDVDAQLAADAVDRPPVWIWVYHHPPDESSVSWTGRRHIGDTDLNRWIDTHRPDVVLTGHIHDSPFKTDGSWIDRIGDTWVLNAGHAPGPIPAHAVIDTSAGTAEWWSPYGSDDRTLWAA